MNIRTMVRQLKTNKLPQEKVKGANMAYKNTLNFSNHKEDEIHEACGVFGIYSNDDIDD